MDKVGVAFCTIALAIGVIAATILQSHLQTQSLGHRTVTAIGSSKG